MSEFSEYPEVCEWREGMTRGVWKSSCSFAPFVDPNPHGELCDYCGEPRVIVRNVRLDKEAE